MRQVILEYLLFICYLLLSNDLTCTAQTIPSRLQTFSNQLKSIMCEEGLNVGGSKCHTYGIQDFLYTFWDHFEDINEDASILADTIIDRLNNKLNLRASFLKNMSYIIQSECFQHAQDKDIDESITEFDDLHFAGNQDRNANLPNNMQYSTVFENTVSFTAPTYRLPNGVDYTADNVRQDAQISELLDDTMVTLYNNYCRDENGNHEYCNMYFGTINGVHTQFPGVENTKSANIYDNFDPRFRPWYVSAATGSKDVVILFDASGSMRENGRLQLAKEAVISVLRTLGSSSFVNVVAFSDNIELSCFENKLVPATSSNVAELMNFINNLEAGGLTNFTKAFDAAFDILSSGKNCETSILFLTDGMADVRDDVSILIERRNTIDINAVIFSFTLGTDSAPDIPKKVAAMTNGIYTHIDDNDENLITAMSSYYLYYAYGGSDQTEDETIVITSPYIDYDTGNIIITMSMPVYINSTYFVGVVGTDIPLQFLSDSIGDITIGRKSYSFVMNQKAELLLHPLILDSLQLFDSNVAYNPIIVNDVEPIELNSTGTLRKMLQRQNGKIKIESTVKQPVGNVAYNGYVVEDANLLYIYAPVGPSSLSIAIVIYTEKYVKVPNVPAFGMKSSPNTVCNETITENNIETELVQCLAPFNMFHRLDLLKQCNSSWAHSKFFNASDHENSDKIWTGFYEGKLYSPNYPIYYLQSGVFEHPNEALNIDPSCEELEELHKLTNRIGSVNYNKLPFGGFRSEIGKNILNAIYTLTSIHEFWKPVFSKNDSLFVAMWFGHYQGLHISFPGKTFPNTYKDVVRPWYQRAISYPDLFVWTTPYQHATTGALVTGASSVIKAPYSDYAYGVLGFNYEYQSFVDYWHNVMGSVCDQNNGDYCFLIDSSAFVLYYDGMEYDTDDEDISHKFFGDMQP
eukprot:6391_1